MRKKTEIQAFQLLCEVSVEGGDTADIVENHSAELVCNWLTVYTLTHISGSFASIKFFIRHLHVEFNTRT